jgi:hypothetical protein
VLGDHEFLVEHRNNDARTPTVVVPRDPHGERSAQFALDSASARPPSYERIANAIVEHTSAVASATTHQRSLRDLVRSSTNA